MRVLKTSYQTVRTVAYHPLDGLLYIHGESKPAKLPFAGGVENWNPGQDDAPSPTDCGPLAVTRMAILPTGELLVSGETRSGVPRWTSPTVIPRAKKAPKELTHCRLPASVMEHDSKPRLIASGVGTQPHHSIVSFKLPIGPRTKVEWGSTLEPVSGVGYLFLADVVCAPKSDQFLSLERTAVVGRQRRHVARWRSADTGVPVGNPLLLRPFGSVSLLASRAARLISMRDATLLSFDLSCDEAAPITVASGNGKHFTGIAVHPDGRRVLATCNDETVREYDAVTLQEIRSYAWKVGKLRCVAIAPDGATAAAGSDTGKVVVWDLE